MMLASAEPDFCRLLAGSPLTPEQQKGGVGVCARRLLLRMDCGALLLVSRHAGHYSGDPRERDAAYQSRHRWGWLLGFFALAHLSRST